MHGRKEDLLERMLTLLAGRKAMTPRPSRVRCSVEPPQFGRLSFWEESYKASDGDSFSWYCDEWADLEPFWADLVPDRGARVLIPGVGNDPTMVDLYDAGWEVPLANPPT